MPTCRICHQEKEQSLFVRSKAFKTGYDTICLECSRAKVKAWREAGKRKAGPEAKRYYDRYPYKGQARAAKRRALQLQATPFWADFAEIETIYSQCPKGYHVDHIVPLQGKQVCGLHVSCNLQILPSKDNLSKGNKFDG
jgi:hypothetical protein